MRTLHVRYDNAAASLGSLLMEYQQQCQNLDRVKAFGLCNNAVMKRNHSRQQASEPVNCMLYPSFRCFCVLCIRGTLLPASVLLPKDRVKKDLEPACTCRHRQWCGVLPLTRKRSFSSLFFHVR
ncbi:hypothetical protein ABZP36_008416 [Zizania latifolia]